MTEQEMLDTIKDDIKIVVEDLDKNRVCDKLVVSDYASDKMGEIKDMITLYLSDGDKSNGIHVCRKKNMALHELGIDIYLRSFIGDAIYVTATYGNKFGILLGELSKD